MNRRSSTLLTLAHRIDSGTRKSRFTKPLIAHGAIYTSLGRDELIRFDGATLEPEWRTPSESFQPWFASRDLIVLDSFHSASVRAIRTNGEVAWTLEPTGRWGWTRWGERLISLDIEQGPALADFETGEIVGHVDFRPRENEVAAIVLGDALILMDAAGGDPHRAYDLVRRQFLWDRHLLSDMARAHPFVNEGFTILRAAGEGRFVAARTNGVCGISLEDGRVLWGARGRAEAVDVENGRVYVCGLAENASRSQLWCLDEATGERIYDVPVDALQVWPAAAISDRFIAYTARSGYIGVFQISDGAPVWSHTHSRGIANAPVIAGRRLFVPADDGSLLVFEGDIE